MQQDHLEVILEDMNSKFDLVLEGHAVLDRKIDAKFDELSEKIELNGLKIAALDKKIDNVENRLNQKIDDVEEHLGKKIDAVASDLKAHREDTESHQGIYRVKEP